MTPAARSAAEFASAMWPSSRWIQTGVFGVTESIHSFRGSSPPQFWWSQFPCRIQAPAGIMAACSLMRRTNSSRVLASRSWTEVRPKPPSMKWTCESMKPGTTIIPFASITRVSGRTSLLISALDPTAVMRSPATRTASAQGRRVSAVHTRALVIASVGIGEIVELVVVIVQASVREAKTRGERRIRKVG